jgi:translation elongation factor EF-1beta
MGENLNFKNFLLTESIEDKIIKSIKIHNKSFPPIDCGQLFWNSEQKAVHFVVGDSTGGYKEAEKALKKIKGINKVVIADEYFPKEKTEIGWKQLKY